MNSRKRATRKKRKQSAAKGKKPVIRCVIFDLDDTLYDCMGQRVRPAHRHAAQAMVNVGLKARVDAVYRARMRAFHKDPMLLHIDAEVCRQFHADNPEKITAAARDAYFHCPVGKLTLFPGTRPLLRLLKKGGVRTFIVSFGEPTIQRAKVKALGLDKESAVESVFYADRDQLLTKEAAFRKIQKTTRLPADQILVVGDRPMSEIRAGKELGMHTVRIHRGEFVSQLPAGPQEKPDYVVKSIAEVRKLPFQWSGIHKE
ncbi:MAG TPA: HAD family hydrolase [Candidatus Angelobacter sp.]|nr:HAD family hydrolase [Candidatus Angelobacter sp.]